MKTFYETPVYGCNSENIPDSHIAQLSKTQTNKDKIREQLSLNKLVLVKSFSIDEAGELFGELVDSYNLRASYDLQMQFVVDMMEDREGVDEIAVTVNERDVYQIIQPHAEGDSTAPLDLFGLYCQSNAKQGGENILSLINQDADVSQLKAKEKAVVGDDLKDADIRKLKQGHLDAHEILQSCHNVCRILKETPEGKIVTRLMPIKKQKSVISEEELYTFWDNITVHDHAFHRFQYEVLKELDLLNDESTKSSFLGRLMQSIGLAKKPTASDITADYKEFMHVENDSDWAPADTDSGDVEAIAKLFDSHVVYKMQPGDFLIFNNRAWTHAVNNWGPGEVRKMFAMYA